MGQEIGSYNLLYAVGEGHTSTVWCAFHRLLKKRVAIKIISKTETPNSVTISAKEAKIIKNAKHPNIIELFEVFEDEHNEYLVMEFLPNGSLKHMINIGGPMSEDKARHYIIQVLTAINYIHSIKIIHRDIKADNIMIDVNNNIRLMDFGMSTHNEFANTSCGSPSYVAPEVLLNNGYDKMVDIWSAGVLLYYLVAGYCPFSEVSMPKLYEKILNSDPTYPETLSPDLIDLIGRMLAKHPASRIAIQDIMKHPWILLDNSESIIINHQDILNENALEEVSNICGPKKDLIKKIINNIDDKDVVMYKILVNSINTDEVYRMKHHTAGKLLTSKRQARTHKPTRFLKLGGKNMKRIIDCLSFAD